MGNGASSNVKSIKLKQNRRSLQDLHEVRERRSNSDGYIVDNLNSSKSKVDMLQLQLKECQQLLSETEERAEKAEEKAKTVEEQMAEVEGENFELIDKVAALGDEIEVLRRDANQDDFTGTVMAKDQSIEKLEKENKDLQVDLKKLRLKAKKRIKSIQTELAETKQESSLKIYSLKQDISRIEEENAKLTQRLDRACSASKSRQFSSEKKDDEPEWEDSRTKLILELSNQVSTLDDKINQLEDELEAKEKIIQELQKLHLRPPSGTRKGSSSKGLKDAHQTDSNRPGSGHADALKQRVSSAGSIDSVESRENIRPDLDSGIGLDESTAASRLSSAPPRMTAESETQSRSAVNEAVSSSRRRRSNKIQKHSSVDVSDIERTRKQSEINSRFFDSVNDAQKDLPSADVHSESRVNSGGARRKNLKAKQAFTSEQISGDSMRTQQQYTEKSKPKIAANFSQPDELDDLLHDIDSVGYSDEHLKKRKKRSKYKSPSSSGDQKVCIDVTVDLEPSIQGISVP
ncbi:uncharacterized protein LOC100371255 [Saccoglossus kowalevskii]|uniref:Myosin-9-like n=1 Tax=Saccoglossus kowalevskii TaxID=10224 RepID=A0ABM0GNA7_SACKO|nr:PREDICTED: myosin-9-like [Saccoglossus kowalevskii]